VVATICRSFTLPALGEADRVANDLLDCFENV
jgi:hypothetical protein